MIPSDNAKTFKADRKLLHTVIRDTEVRDHLMQFELKWKFKLEKVPWWGGVFERIVRVTKRCMKKMVSQAMIVI